MLDPINSKGNLFGSILQNNKCGRGKGGMSKHYKIWIEIEEIDEKKDLYINLEDPRSIGGEFATEKDARDFRRKLINGFGER